MTIATPVKILLKNLQLAPGSMVTITEVSWEEFEAILTELGEERRTRIVYCNGVLEIMSPLPAHERPHRMIGYIVTALLDAQERDWEDFGSTTFKEKAKKVGLEPDICFYIDHAEAVRDCLRMDLSLYPPPDLAIEADVTSETTLEAYELLQVPEVWIYDSGKLMIYLLENGQYQESTLSQIFPNLPIATLVPELIAKALQVGSSQMLRELRRQMTAEGLVQ